MANILTTRCLLNPETISNSATMYKICAPGTDLIFIGSTQIDLSKKLNEYEYYYQLWLEDDSNRYHSVFKILEHGDAWIESLGDIMFNDIDDLREQEEEIICKAKNCVNGKMYKRSNNKTICECGGHYIDTKAAQKAHENTKKHQNYLVKKEAAAEVLRMVEEEGYEYFESISELGSESESEYPPEDESISECYIF